MPDYSRILDVTARDAALSLCRGEYQRNLILGREALSGATLTGRARDYSGRYRASGRNLLARMTAAGIPWREDRGARGKRILVIGERDPVDVQARKLPPMFPCIPVAA